MPGKGHTMANYAVNYARPAKSLLTLRAELDAVFPGRFIGADGFITGYDSQANPRYGSSGHNPNSLGHVMAFDISTTNTGPQIDEATGRALAEYLRVKANAGFRYLIHDMAAGAPEPKIAGDFSAWGWRAYTGDPHSNHIHISLTDDYQWGEDCGLAQAIYDDESSWGIAAWYAAYKAGTSTPPPTPAKPAPTIPQGAVTKRKTYPLSDIHWEVEKGDTLSRITVHYLGAATSANLKRIADYNGISVNDVIKPKDNIWIPGPLYWEDIQPADTIRTIAAYYGLNPLYLARLNGLPSADSTIYNGNNLIIKK